MTRGEKGKRTGCRMLLSLLLILSVLFPTGMPRAFAAQQGAQLIELRISDWSYEEYHQIRRYEYDGNGVLKRETSTSYSDERFREKRQESSTSYDYYDNGALRMSYGNGWETHYDRFGTQIDGPVPAVPNMAYIVWYDDSVEHYYDLNGNLTRVEAFNLEYDSDSGEMTSVPTIYQYRYDDSGRILESKTTAEDECCLSFRYAQGGSYSIRGEWNYGRNPDGSTTVYYEEEYDPEGRILRRIDYDESYGDAFIYETAHEYSADGMLETIRSFSVSGGDRQLENTTEVRREYNSRGDVLREESFLITEYGEERTERKEYEYDRDGNLIHLQVFAYGYGPPTLIRDEKRIYQ